MDSLAESVARNINLSSQKNDLSFIKKAFHPYIQLLNQDTTRIFKIHSVPGRSIHAQMSDIYNLRARNDPFALSMKEEKAKKKKHDEPFPPQKKKN